MKISRILRRDTCPGESVIESLCCGELESGEAEQVRAHLQNCSACRTVERDFEIGLNYANLLRESRQDVPRELREKVTASACSSVTQFLLANLVALGRDVSLDAQSEDEKHDLWIQELIACLPERYRDVVRLCVLEKLTFQATAVRLGLSEETVRGRYTTLHRTLARWEASRDHD